MAGLVGGRATVTVDMFDAGRVGLTVAIGMAGRFERPASDGEALASFGAA